MPSAAFTLLNQQETVHAQTAHEKHRSKLSSWNNRLPTSENCEGSQTEFRARGIFSARARNFGLGRSKKGVRDVPHSFLPTRTAKKTYMSSKSGRRTGLQRTTASARPADGHRLVLPLRFHRHRYIHLPYVNGWTGRDQS